MNKKLPDIAFGTWSWGVGAVGGNEVFGNNITATDVQDVFDTAMVNGLNLWDTAVVYGMGESEKTLAEVAKIHDREDIIISTKFTPQIAGGGKDAMEQMLAGSLKRFGTDYMDLYWIHNPADVEKYTPMLIPFVKSGKIKRVGVSNHNLAQIKRAEEILAKEGVHISAIQNHYSLLYRSSEYAGILDYCKARNITFFAYMVLEQGALSGKYNTKNLLPENSQRGQTYNPVMDKIEKITAVMAEVGAKYGATPAQIALSWAIAKGTTPIIGVTKVSQVLDAVKAKYINLTAEETSAIENAAGSSGVDTRGSWENPMI